MRLYADGIVRGWLERHPEDHLTILGGSWVAEQFGDVPAVTVVVWPNDSFAARVVGQFVVSAIVMRVTRSEVLVSLSSIVTPLVRRHQRTCVVHDWRHIKSPGEFGRAQLMYRKLWRRSIKGAGAVIAISEKTYAETKDIVPGSRVVVVENGRDYVRYWPTPVETDGGSASATVVTFGHFPNKRPELVLEALAILLDDGDAAVNLVVLGAKGTHRQALMARAEELGILASCTFPGFVEESDYQRLIRSSSLIVLASSDEGFGLPVAEANYLGVPALVTSDSGLAQIHKQGVVLAEPTAQSIATAMRFALEGNVPRAELGGLTTWTDTAEGVRNASLLALGRTKP